MFKLIFHILIISLFATFNVKGQTKIIRLECEHKVNPLAVEMPSPRLSWVLQSEAVGQKQTAYEIKAWNEKEVLWNSGKINSDQSLNISYNGKIPSNGSLVKWTVKVWDKDQKEIHSDTAFFRTAIAAKDWNAAWIGEKEDKSLKLLAEPERSKWIWFPELEQDMKSPQGTRYFKLTFNAEDTSAYQFNKLYITSDDKSIIKLNGKSIGENGWMKIGVLDLKGLKKGKNILEVEVFNQWGESGLWAQVVLEKKNGQKQILISDNQWKVSKDGKSFIPAVVTSDFGKGVNKEWLNINMFYDHPVKPASYFRKTFGLKNKLKSATLYATSLGVYEIHLNGKKVTDNYYAPGWTDYNKRLLYQAYDVTQSIQLGDNAIGAIVGDGWYVGTVGYGHSRGNYGTYPVKILAQIKLEFEDGTTDYIVTDGSWKVTSNGPIRMSDFLDGEIYDARMEMKGWNTTTFNDSHWLPANLHKTSNNILTDVGVPVQKIKEFVPTTVTEVGKNKYVFDLGQNIAGIYRLKIKGQKGSQIQLKFGEMLNKDGTVYTENLRSAKVTDTYILSGNGEEVYEPYFTFHGFRYIEVTGSDVKLTSENITGIAIGSNTPEIGTFETSSQLVNQIYSNVYWGQRDNFLSVPTDCPQRDERLGWMGDAQIFARTASYNCDVHGFFKKWMGDVIDAQKEDGGFSDVAPRLVDLTNGAPGWGDAGVIVPWVIYEMYDDKKILSDNYEAMKNWIKLIHDSNADNLWKNNRYNDFGDWLSINANTDKEVLATAFYAYSTKLLSKAANVLDKKEDVQYYEGLYNQIKKAFENAYVDKEGKIRGNTQTAYILAIRFDLLSREKREMAVRHLVNNIAENKYHHTTGFLGIGHLMPVLTETNNIEIAYRLLNNTDFPSWGFMIKNGATTIWERWDGYTPEKGFQDKTMNSFNHYSLGSVGEWMYSTVGGISPLTSGFKKIKIAPIPGGGLTFANTTYDSPYGKILTSWKLEGNKYELSLTIPSNTTAEIVFPGKVESKSSELISLKSDERQTVFSAPSGYFNIKGIIIK